MCLGYTLSLLLAFLKDLGCFELIPKGLGTQVPDPVTPLRPCCGKTRQSKRLLSILIVQSRISGNLLSSLLIIGQATINLDSRVWRSLEDSLPKLYCVDLAEAHVTQEGMSMRLKRRKKE